MREILFRGKRLSTGEWVFGYYFYDPVFKKHYIKNGEFGAEKTYPVNPETIGQFTGLTDKDGRKIFEGDIITDPDYPDKYIVNFSEAAFIAKSVESSESCWLRDFWLFNEPQCIILGNIHDNPELIRSYEERG